MLFTKFHFIFLSIVLMTGEPFLIKAQSSLNLVKWVIEKNSTLRVDGKSNVNSFTCNIDEYNASDTISLTNGSAMSIKLSGKIQMEIVSFN